MSMQAPAIPPVTSTDVHDRERSHHIGKSPDEPLVGLALSGGGIRSATFGLGVLQGLYSLGVYERLDYISTVSGGGYIGGWLQAAVANGRVAALERQRRTGAARNPLPSRLQQLPDAEAGAVQRRHLGGGRQQPAQPDPQLHDPEPVADRAAVSAVAGRGRVLATRSRPGRRPVADCRRGAAVHAGRGGEHREHGAAAAAGRVDPVGGLTGEPCRRVRPGHRPGARGHVARQHIDVVVGPRRLLPERRGAARRRVEGRAGLRRGVDGRSRRWFHVASNGRGRFARLEHARGLPACRPRRSGAGGHGRGGRLARDAAHGDGDARPRLRPRGRGAFVAARAAGVPRLPRVPDAGRLGPHRSGRRLHVGRNARVVGARRRRAAPHLARPDGARRRGVARPAHLRSHASAGGLVRRARGVGEDGAECGVGRVHRHRRAGRALSSHGHRTGPPGPRVRGQGRAGGVRVRLPPHPRDRDPHGGAAARRRALARRDSGDVRAVRSGSAPAVARQRPAAGRRAHGRCPRRRIVEPGLPRERRDRPRGAGRTVPDARELGRAGLAHLVAGQPERVLAPHLLPQPPRALLSGRVAAARAAPVHGVRRQDDVPLAPPSPGAPGHPVRPYPIFNAAINLVAGKNLAWQERKAASFVFTPEYCGFEYRDDDDPPAERKAVAARAAENAAMRAEGGRERRDHGAGPGRGRETPQRLRTHARAREQSAVDHHGAGRSPRPAPPPRPTWATTRRPRSPF